MLLNYLLLYRSPLLIAHNTADTVYSQGFFSSTMSLLPNHPRTASSLNPDPPGSAGARGKDGRTPPPAPSAVYSRRAKQIIEDETGMPAYQPSIQDDGSGEDGVGVVGGFRRARAGSV